MIELLFAPTPNCWKVTIFLEEAEIDYRLTPVRLNEGDNFKSSFLFHAPNNRVPGMIDHDPGDHGAALSMFESGAMLLYLARKYRRFMPADPRGEAQVVQWLMWQMAGLGPMLGQHGHFILYAEEKIPYAIMRFHNEARRLYTVLDTQLGKTGAHVAGQDYSIADMACFPWIMTHKAQGFTLDDWPHIKRWFSALRQRPALQRGLAAGKQLFAQRSEMSREMQDRIYGIIRDSTPQEKERK